MPWWATVGLAIGALIEISQDEAKLVLRLIRAELSSIVARPDHQWWEPQIRRITDLIARLEHI